MLNDFLYIANCFLEIISGLYLIIGVFQIRAFYTSLGIEHSVNTKVLMLHASAFSLYLLACLAESVGYTLYVVAPHTFRQVYIWTAVFVALFSFVA